MSINIDKGIPIPEGRRLKYPFQIMEIGDSFFAEKAGSSYASAARYKERHPDFNFKASRENGGLRIWRVPATENKEGGQ